MSDWRTMERYERGEKLGQGQFGEVFRAVEKETGRVVAIKRVGVGSQEQGINFTALREIKLLKELKGEYIVPLVDVFLHKRNLNLVFDFMECDLEAVIKDTSLKLADADVKSYLQMTLKALEHCHKNWIVHRDVKPNNLLVSSDGMLKLTDFGLARLFGSPDRRFTAQVFARWYRPVELLCGSKHYGPAVDMWACGCVFAELMLRKPVFPGTSDLDQLTKIFTLLGTPTEEQWPGMRCLPQFMECRPCPAPPMRKFFPTAPDAALDLLSRMLCFDPNRRISATDALNHHYFREGDPPRPPGQLPRPSKKVALNPLMKRSIPSGMLAPHVHDNGKEQTEGPVSEEDPPEAPPTKQRISSLPDGTPAAMPRRSLAPPSTRPGAGMMSVEEATVPPSVTMFTPMSTEGMRDHKPVLNTVDRNYLLQRKLQMDEELAGANAEDMNG